MLLLLSLCNWHHCCSCCSCLPHNCCCCCCHCHRHRCCSCHRHHSCFCCSYCCCSCCSCHRHNCFCCCCCCCWWCHWHRCCCCCQLCLSEQNKIKLQIRLSLEKYLPLTLCTAIFKDRQSVGNLLPCLALYTRNTLRIYGHGVDTYYCKMFISIFFNCISSVSWFSFPETWKVSVVAHLQIDIYHFYITLVNWQLQLILLSSMFGHIHYTK